MFNWVSHEALGLRRVLVEAGAVMDGAGVFARPGALAISEEGKVVFAGPPEGVPAGFRGPETTVLRLPDRLLVPGMVNAHAHLDMGFLPRWRYDGSFTGWVGRVMREKAAAPAGQWKGRYLMALGFSHVAGVAAVGDIVPADKMDEAMETMAMLDAEGVLFSEQFGHDACAWDREPPVRKETKHAAMACEPEVRGPRRKRGIQPHAPYSAGPDVFDAACKSGLPLSTHLAETPEEAQFVANAAGPFRDLLERLGKWKPQIAVNYAAGQSPVQWMAPYLRQAPWLLAHVNYASDADLEILAEAGASVAYCPVASDYFLHTGHRYRDMLAAGINVCLGTDSMVCQPNLQRREFGILPQMRHLFQRDKVEAQILLQMATVNGAKALGLPERDFTFAPGVAAMPLALVFDPSNSATPPLEQALWRREGVEWVGGILGMRTVALRDAKWMALAKQWGMVEEDFGPETLGG